MLDVRLVILDEATALHKRRASAARDGRCRVNLFTLALYVFKL